MTSRSSLSLLGLASLLLSAAACGQILGLDKFTEGEAGGGGGTTGTTTTSTSTTGTGGTGGNPPVTCSPGEVKACPYGGPGATENKGVCKAGTQTCLPNGSGFGECSGEVRPTTEDCATPDDEDCDGTPNQSSAGCVCAAGTMEACYEGDPATAHKGLCKDGTHTCKPDGKGWGPCDGQVLPKAESCATPEDDSCDGQANEGCPCAPNSTSACYSADPATKGKGVCKEGSWTCKADGSGYGACMGEVPPAASDDCSNQVDEDCSGTYCTEPVWANSYSSSPVVNDLTADANGNTYITGVFVNPLEFTNPPLISAGGPDGFVAKIDPSGSVAWAIRFGDIQNQFGNGIAVDSTGNIIIVGYFRNSVTFGATTLGGPSNDTDQIFVAKLDSNGNALWARQFGDPAGSIANQDGLAVAVDTSDNIIFAGKFSNQIDLGTGSTILAKGTTDAFIAKIDKTGTATLYAKTFGTAGATTIATRVAVDSSGNAMVIGTFTGTVNFGFASPTIANASGPDAFLLRVSAAGSSSWLKTFGNGKQIYFSDIKTDTTGNAVLAGGFQGSVNIGSKTLTVPMSGTQANPFLAQFNSAGTTNWAVQFGNTVASALGNSTAGRLATNADGDILLTGACYSTFDMGFNLDCPQIGSNPFLIMTTSAGVPSWGRSFGTGALKTVSFAAPPFANVSATSNSFLDFGKGPIPTGTVTAKIATK